jgi:hypothetical protein
VIAARTSAATSGVHTDVIFLMTSSHFSASPGTLPLTSVTPDRVVAAGAPADPGHPVGAHVDGHYPLEHDEVRVVPLAV